MGIAKGFICTGLILSLLVGCSNEKINEENNIEEPQQKQEITQEEEKPTRIVDDLGHEYLLEWNGYKFEGKEYEGIGVRGVSVEAHADSATEIVEAFKDCEYELYKIGGSDITQLADAVLLYEGTRNDWVKDVEKDAQTHISGMIGIGMISSILQDVHIIVVDTDGMTIYSYENGEPVIGAEEWMSDKQLQTVIKAMENVQLEFE